MIGGDSNPWLKQWMTKPAKLYEQLLASTARSVNFRDFEQLITSFGFEHRRTRGSHRHYGHPAVPTILTINPDGAEARRYQIRLLLELVEEYGLHIEA